MPSLKVNFSKDEAESTAREVPSSGEYYCKVVEVEMKEVKPGSANVGKPYWAIQFVIQDGTFAGSRLFSNIMLFEGKDGTLSSLSQFLKAIGYDVQAGEFDLPDADDLIEKDINVKGTKYLAGWDKKAQRDLPDRFQVRSYKPAKVGTKPNPNSDLLP